MVVWSGCWWLLRSNCSQRPPLLLLLLLLLPALQPEAPHHHQRLRRRRQHPLPHPPTSQPPELRSTHPWMSLLPRPTRRQQSQRP